MGHVMSEPPTAFLQVDVDGLWAIRRCYGRAEGDSFTNDPVWSEGVPRSQDVFAELGLKAGYFLVGRDLMSEGKAATARRIAEAGHEIGNHSFSHRLGLTMLPIGGIAQEITRAEKAMDLAGLPRPRGFRAPGYDVDSRVLRTVRRLGYAYDASVLPTPWSPAMRLADAWMAGRWQSSKRQFGRLAYARAPRVPYEPDANRIRNPARREPAASRRFLEIPVGVLPGRRLPLTASTVFALGSKRVVRGLRELARRGQPTLVLLHGIDFVDCKRPLVFPAPRSMGGFDLSAAEKMRRLGAVLKCLRDEFKVQRADE